MIKSVCRILCGEETTGMTELLSLVSMDDGSFINSFFHYIPLI